jgi:hypothetical protein
MNAVTVFNPGAVRPAYAKQGELSAVAKALAGGGASGKRLSIKGCVFRLMVDGKEVTSIEDRYLDVVIVNAAPKVHRTFYAGAYVEGNTSPPTCWSADGNAPDPAVKTKQAATCAACPQNVAGSGQGDSRACRFGQQVAIVLANDIEGDVMQLSLPAASIFGKAEGENRPLQDYVRYMLAQGIDVTQLVTRLKFDTTVATPKLFFKPMRWLEQDEFEICQKQGTSPDAIKAVTMTVSQMDGVQPAPAAAAPAAFTAPAATKPAPAPAPVVDEEPPAPPPKARKPRAAAAPAPLPPEPEPEPTVRQAAPAATARVPATSTLMDTLNAWDDE